MNAFRDNHISGIHQGVLRRYFAGIRNSRMNVEAHIFQKYLAKSFQQITRVVLASFPNDVAQFPNAHRDADVLHFIVGEIGNQFFKVFKIKIEFYSKI